MPTAWTLPAAIIIKKQKPDVLEQFANKLQMYERLKVFQGKQIPICYGEASCDGTPALILQDVSGVSLLDPSVLVSKSEEQLDAMMFTSYRPILNTGIAYDD